jgi:hypothetical protein
MKSKNQLQNPKETADNSTRDWVQILRPQKEADEASVALLLLPLQLQHLQ